MFALQLPRLLQFRVPVDRRLRSPHFCQNHQRRHFGAELVVPRVFLCHAAQHIVGHRDSVVGICHDRHALAALRVHRQERLKSLVRSVMPKLPGVFFLHKKSQARSIHHRR